MTAIPFQVHGRIQMATVSCPNIDAVEASYLDLFHYQTLDEGVIDSPLAHAWGAAATRNARYKIMGPRLDDSYVIRLIDGVPAEDFAPLTTYGWAALEVAVEDVDAMLPHITNYPFQILGVPRDIKFSGAVRPMQCAGLAKEAFFLTEIVGKSKHYTYPLPQSYVDQLFIVILGARDRAATLEFYKQALNFEHAADYDMEYRSLNKAFGFKEGTKQQWSMTRASGLPGIQIDQYPDDATERPQQPDNLPPGISMITFLVDSLSDIQLDWLSEPLRRPEMPYNGRRAATFKGPSKELVEVIERA